MEEQTKPKPIEIDLPPHGGGALQVHQPENGAIQSLDADSRMIDMIERACRDPAVDVTKLKALMDMHAAYEQRIAEREFDAALAQVQEAMAPVRADLENKQTQSKYASHVAMDKALRPIYSKKGFSLSFNTEPGASPDTVRVECRVARGGYHRDYKLDIPADGKGAKGGDVMTKTHATGSAVSYGIRYLIRMIFNLPIQRDDDGNSAGATCLTEDQVTELREHIKTINNVVSAAAEEVGAKYNIVDEKKVAANYRVENIEAIPSNRFQHVKAALSQWSREQIKSIGQRRTAR